MRAIIFRLIFLLGIPWIQLGNLDADSITNQSNIDHVCVVLAIDNSGSMKVNDAGFLRNTGARLFIALLDEGDYVGLIRFSDHPIRDTHQLMRVGTPQDKMQLLDRIQNQTPDGATDLLGAVVEAAALFDNAPCPERHIVLLSDGQPELPGGIPAGYEDQAVAALQKVDARVIAIALTPAGESGFLFQLSNSTQPPGTVIPARSASDLLDAYLQALSILKDRTIVGSGAASSPGRITFALDPGLSPFTSQVTYIVSKPNDVDVQLLDPDHQVISTSHPRLSFSATRDPQFAVYTIQSPPPGNWQFEFSGQGEVQARAIIRSRLRIHIQQPTSFWPTGEPMPISATIVEEDSTGRIASLIGEGNLSAEILRPDGSLDLIDRLYDDGTHGDLRASDGIYTSQYVKTDLPGKYRIRVWGYKGMIPLSQTTLSQLVEFPTIVIDEPHVASLQIHPEPVEIVTHLKDGSPATFDQGTVLAHILQPDGNRITIPLDFVYDQWLGEFVPLLDGEYQIEILSDNAVYKGIPYTTRAHHLVHIQRIPKISLSLNHLDLGQVHEQDFAGGVTRSIPVESSSRKNEPVTVQAAGLPAWVHLSTLPGQIAPGNSTIFLTLSGNASPGIYQGTLLFSVDQGVDLSIREIPIRIEITATEVAPQENAVAAALKRFAFPIAGAFGGILVTLTALRSYLLSRPRPWGMLRLVKAPRNTQLPTTIQLSKAARSRFAAQVSIGSDPKADISLTGNQISPLHALFKATRITTAEKYGKPPKFFTIHKLVNVIENVGNKAILVGQQTIQPGQQSAPLRQGIRITIGNYEFEYRG